MCCSANIAKGAHRMPCVHHSTTCQLSPNTAVVHCRSQDNPYYVQFRMFSCEAYNILRKSADLILSLFHLMAGASIEAIRANPENAMLKLQEKLRLDLDDEQAVEWMQGLINESATALMPQLVEATHRWAQALK